MSLKTYQFIVVFEVIAHKHYVRKAHWRMSTWACNAREHESMQGTLAHEPVSTQDTLTREHVSM